MPNALDWTGDWESAFVYLSPFSFRLGIVLFFNW